MENFGEVFSLFGDLFNSIGEELSNMVTSSLQEGERPYDADYDDEGGLTVTLRDGEFVDGSDRELLAIGIQRASYGKEQDLIQSLLAQQKKGVDCNGKTTPYSEKFKINRSDVENEWRIQAPPQYDVHFGGRKTMKYKELKTKINPENNGNVDMQFTFTLAESYDKIELCDNENGLCFVFSSSVPYFENLVKKYGIDYFTLKVDDSTLRNDDVEFFIAREIEAMVTRAMIDGLKTNR